MFQGLIDVEPFELLGRRSESEGRPRQLMQARRLALAFYTMLAHRNYDRLPRKWQFTCAKRPRVPVRHHKLCNIPGLLLWGVQSAEDVNLH